MPFIATHNTGDYLARPYQNPANFLMKGTYKDGKQNMTATGICCPVASSGVPDIGRRGMRSLRGYSACSLYSGVGRWNGFEDCLDPLFIRGVGQEPRPAPGPRLLLCALSARRTPSHFLEASRPT